MNERIITNVAKLPTVDKPIRSAILEEKDGSIKHIIIKKYTGSNHDVIQELRNEQAALKYIKEHVRFPAGISAPESLFIHIEEQLVNTVKNGAPCVKTIINAYQGIERIQGQDLFDWMLSNSQTCCPGIQAALQNTLRKIVDSLALCVFTLHKYGIVHSDIKLDNIMIYVTPDGDVNLAIIDFAYFHLIKDKRYATEFYVFAGTNDYVSPELYLRIPYNLFANDVWCFGMTLYSLYTTLMINREYDCIEDHIRVCRLQCDISLKENMLPQEIYNLLVLIFVPEDKRITMEGIIKYLNIDLMEIDE